MNRIYFLTIALLLLLLSSCEEEFIPDAVSDPEEIVVEGYIEAGEQALPPYVILTRSVPFFTRIGVDDLNDLFIHDAEVRVIHQGQETMLEEVCWNDFNEQEQELLQLILDRLDVKFDSLGINFCAYLDPEFQLEGEIGESYDLIVDIGEERLTATTSIPPHVPLDSLRFVRPSGDIPDSLFEMRGYVSDPVDQANFYRYFTSVNLSLFEAGYNSVADDLFFNGLSFEFPLPKSEPRNETPNLRTFGLYVEGDTVGVRWCNIDEPHFRFWSTLEFNALNQGPFSSYTRVDSNVEGGIGIWGGYSVSYYMGVVEE